MFHGLFFCLLILLPAAPASAGHATVAVASNFAVPARVVLDGHDVELRDGVKEFTDWDALAKTIASFVNA